MEYEELWNIFQQIGLSYITQQADTNEPKKPAWNI
jgi:transposase